MTRRGGRAGHGLPDPPEAKKEGSPGSLGRSGRLAQVRHRARVKTAARDKMQETARAAGQAQRGFPKNQTVSHGARARIKNAAGDDSPTAMDVSKTNPRLSRAGAPQITRGPAHFSTSRVDGCGASGIGSRSNARQILGAALPSTAADPPGPHLTNRRRHEEKYERSRS